MGKKLPPDQLEFYRRVDEILYYKWDPIGVSDSDWARDEYQSYLPRVFVLALEGNSSEIIANYLGVVSTESMGLSHTPEHDLKIARLIIEIKEKIGV
ncbi:hypothetical protein LL273_09290 [Marinobacter salarius]|uniref:hypothetical protein n=1 Tax=Marinobacter salarius TaxID=1420917 RepID=UPI001D184FFB|nr:hypothetical protein [Marinobacter salarius]MCC4283920.1 hypothetical protein [Marinobacter salarius]